MSIEVIYEDNHIIIVNKKTGDIFQADKTGDSPLSEKVKEYLKKKYQKPGNVFLWVVHRLDRPVSGIVIFAKTGKALSRINKLLREKKLEKVYWAVVKNKPPENESRLIHYLKRNRKKNKSFAYDSEITDSKKAVLNYKLLASSDRYFLLEIKLETGRHHQIRTQLSKIGCPIKGDLKYGFDRSNPNGGIHLHARKISFIHPVKKQLLTLTTPPPDDILWNKFIELTG